MRERRVEERLIRAVRDLGGLCIKLTPPPAGIPDRLVLLPGGVVEFIELKAPGGQLRPIQRVIHERLRARGHQVLVISSVREVDEWRRSMST